MDSFKGILSSLKVAGIAEQGIKKVYKDADVEKVAIDDGGEGTIEAIVETLNGQYIYTMVKGPLGKVVVKRLQNVEFLVACGVTNSLFGVEVQTIYRKAPVGVAARDKKFGKPVYAITGFIGEGAHLVYQYGTDAVMSSMVGPLLLEEAIVQSQTLIEQASEGLFRIIKFVIGDN